MLLLSRSLIAWLLCFSCAKPQDFTSSAFAVDTLSTAVVTDNLVRSVLVTNVVDGDTFDGEVDLRYDSKHVGRFRLLGYDAPEIRGVSTTEIAAGKHAKAVLAELLAGRVVYVRGDKKDSFGRWLVDVQLPDGRDPEDVLLTLGLGSR